MSKMQPYIGDIENCTAIISRNKYSPVTTKAYISVLSFSLKCQSIQNNAQSFIIINKY